MYLNIRRSYQHKRFTIIYSLRDYYILLRLIKTINFKCNEQMLLDSNVSYMEQLTLGKRLVAHSDH